MADREPGAEERLDSSPVGNTLRADDAAGLTADQVAQLIDAGGARAQAARLPDDLAGDGTRR